MRILNFALIVLFLLGSVPGMTSPQKKRIHLVTHESSPFMDPKLPDQGALIHALKIIFKKMNYDFEVTILDSWPRAKSKAAKDPTIDGYVPYVSKENTDEFLYSDYFHSARWGLAERKDNPIQWKKIEDLAAYRAGNVQGVEYRGEIKALVESGKLKVTTTSLQENNIRLLATRRVDFIFTDLTTFAYELKTNKALAEFKDVLQINPKPITISRYGLAIRKNRLPENFLEEFNKYSKDMDSYHEAYFKNLQ